MDATASFLLYVYLRMRWCDHKSIGQQGPTSHMVTSVEWEQVQHWGTSQRDELQPQSWVLTTMSCLRGDESRGHFCAHKSDLRESTIERSCQIVSSPTALTCKRIWQAVVHLGHVVIYESQVGKMVVKAVVPFVIAPFTWIRNVRYVCDLIHLVQEQTSDPLRPWGKSAWIERKP